MAEPELQTEPSQEVQPAASDAYRRRKILGIPVQPWTIAVAIVIVIAVVAMATAPGRKAREEAERQERVDAWVAAMTPVDVIYEVEGNGSYFDMTSQSPTGTQQSTAKMPMRNQAGGAVTMQFKPGDFVYISGQSRDGTSITCRIKVDGKVISENTSTGEYAIATCDGTA